jgi:hypothetical protein
MRCASSVLESCNSPTMSASPLPPDLCEAHLMSRTTPKRQPKTTDCCTTPSIRRVHFHVDGEQWTRRHAETPQQYKALRPYSAPASITCAKVLRNPQSTINIGNRQFQLYCLAPNWNPVHSHLKYPVLDVNGVITYSIIVRHFVGRARINRARCSALKSTRTDTWA